MALLCVSERVKQKAAANLTLRFSTRRIKAKFSLFYAARETKERDNNWTELTGHSYLRDSKIALALI